MPDQLPERIVPIPEDKLSAEQKKVLAELAAGRGRVPRPFHIWIYSPQVAVAMSGMGTFLNEHSTISKREVELGVALMALHWQCEYLFVSHGRRYIERGGEQSVLDALKAGRTPNFPNERERAMHILATAANAPGAGSDGMFDEVLEILGRDGLADVLCLFGYYSTVAMAMKLHRVPVPA